jgi:WhiB family redox-sensing transcriptional regulator
MSTQTCCEMTPSAVPCQVGDADLWFSEKRVDMERAKAICAGCPIRRECLAAALQRHEPWGVWGGEIVERGTIAAAKRSRGRPRKNIVDGPHPRRAGRPDRPFSRCAP